MDMRQFPDEGAKAWMLRYARRNYWRVAAWMDFDDLIQEGYYSYFDTLRRYPTAVEPAHIMCLFKMYFVGRIEDLVRMNRKQIDDARSDIVEVFDGPAMTLPDPSNFNTLMAKAPEVIKKVLSLMSDNKSQDELNKPLKRYDNGRRETLNERICSILGYDAKKVDVTKEVRAYFAT